MWVGGRLGISKRLDVVDAFADVTVGTAAVLVCPGNGEVWTGLMDFVVTEDVLERKFPTGVSAIGGSISAFLSYAHD